MVMVCDNMTRKRSRLEMYLDVLEKVNAGISRPTNIMYKCNLSWVPLQEILASLIERDLIKEIEKKNKRTYEITERGQDLLRYLEHMLAVLENREISKVSPGIMGTSSILAKIAPRRNLSSASRSQKMPSRNRF
ncbi:hypothetical protein B6U79_03440 [Candidatus Bathyarchaeota archaeon ex4484_231]|nr:MAG: hypothetical protein B6U79_03440 [Candidatus Bathyarchaeota archaeon ex4484_231]RJS75134.1 MAG: DUF4364 family protein [Candidatus Bathyarchaeota archaeon]